MPKVVVSHGVVDIQRWLEGNAERVAALKPYGANLFDTVAHDGSNRVSVGMDVSDLDGLMAMLASPTPELAGLMEKHGVQPPFTAYVEK